MIANKRRKILQKTGFVWIMAIALSITNTDIQAATTKPVSPSSSQSAAKTDPSEWRKVVEAAKREGKIITVDDREVEKHRDIPIYLPGCQVQRLEAGDYAFNDYDTNPVGIERCEISNLMQKLNSGELESQLRIAEELYAKFYLLVEGVWDEDDNAVQSYKRVTMNLRGHHVKAYIATKRHGFFQYDRLQADCRKEYCSGSNR